MNNRLVHLATTMIAHQKGQTQVWEEIKEVLLNIIERNRKIEAELMKFEKVK